MPSKTPFQARLRVFIQTNWLERVPLDEYLYEHLGTDAEMAVSDFRALNARLRSRLQMFPSDTAEVESCRRDLAALAPKVALAIEAELLRLTLASSPSAA